MFDIWENVSEKLLKGTDAHNLCLSIAFLNSRSDVGEPMSVVKQQESGKDNKKRELDKRK